MAKARDLKVKFSADGVKTVKAAFRTIGASARQGMKAVSSAAAQTQRSLAMIAKPVRITIGGTAQIARITALAGAAAAALGSLEVSKDLAAGQSLTAMEQGLRVAASSSKDTAKAYRELADEQKAAAKAADLDTEAKKRNADAAVAAAIDQRELLKTANELGVEIEKVGPAYVGLANSTKGTQAQGKATIRVFRGMLMAGQALGRSNEEIEGGLLAIGQMAGKGKVSMEELRGQLGERIPGAMGIAARAYGVTIEQMGKMVEAGLDSADFVDKFGKQLVKEFGPAAEQAANKPAASFARLKNSIFLARAQIANSGLADALGRIAQRVSALITYLDQTGAIARFGQRMSAAIDRLPYYAQLASYWFSVLKFNVQEWLRQMQVALGLDYSQIGAKAQSGLSTLLALVQQLAFDIPGVIYAFRQAMAGNDAGVADRYRWVLELLTWVKAAKVEFERWAPVVRDTAGMVFEALKKIKDAMIAVFGEDGARTAAIYLIIMKLAGGFGILKAVAVPVLSLIGTAITALAAALGLPVIAVAAIVAAVAAAGYLIYKHFDTLWAGLKSMGSAIYDALAWPFKKVAALVGKIVDGVAGAWGSFKDSIGLGGDNSGSDLPAYRNGGVIRGPGTGRSDSIIARVSNGEGIITARAVRHYGSGFVDMLNSLALPKFADGGVVGAVAGSSQSGPSGRPFQLVIPGVGSMSGSADRGAPEGITRALRRKMAGRSSLKPRWA